MSEIKKAVPCTVKNDSDPKQSKDNRGFLIIFRLTMFKIEIIEGKKYIMYTESRNFVQKVECLYFSF